MAIKHPIGNKRIYFIKKCSKFLNYFILFFLSLILKINRHKDEIIISTSFYAPWNEDVKFNSFYKKISHLTLLDIKRAYTLWYLANDLKNINASILDIGCLQGGAGFLMSGINKAGYTYLFDTFDGFLEEEKYHKKKHFIYRNVNAVKKNINKFNLFKTKVYKCNFPNNLDAKFKQKKYKLCHIDVNTYKSTQNAFNFINKKLIKGGVVVFDDYGIYGTDSIKKFIKKISISHNKDFTFIYNFMGQCILIKK